MFKNITKSEELKARLEKIQADLKAKVITENEAVCRLDSLKKEAALYENSLPVGKFSS